MVTAIGILCILVWLPLLFGQVARRGFFIMLIWLLIAPVASNLVNRPGVNPFFQSPAEHAEREEGMQDRRKGYFDPAGPVQLNRLFEPTRILLGIFVVLFLLDVLLKRRRLRPFDWAENWMVVFSIIMLASVPLESTRFNNSLRTVGDAFLVPFLAYFLTKRLLTSEEQLRQFMRVIGWVGFSLIIISLLERLTHPGWLYRLGGPFREATSLYLAITMAFFIVLVEAFSRKTLLVQKRILPPSIGWLILCLSPIISFLTWSRGIWVGFLVSLWVFLFLGRRMVSFSSKLLYLGLAPLLILVVVISVWAFAPVEIIQQRSSATGTVYGRFATWKIAMQEGISHPVFGIGFNNMRAVLARRMAPFQGSGEFATVHNSYLAIFAEQGIIGLFAYVAIIACVMRMGLSLYRFGPHSQDRWRGVAVIAIMVAYLVPALFASTLHGAASAAYVPIFAFLGGIARLYGRHSLVRDSPPLSIARYESVSESALIVIK